MALSSRNPVPVVIHQGDANWWGITDTDIQTPIDAAPRALVTMQVMKLDADRRTRLWVAPPQTITYIGERLAVVMADALARSVAYQEVVPADQALYLGIRDALYDALKVDGYIPAQAN